MTSSNPGTASAPVSAYVYDSSVSTSPPTLPSDIYVVKGGTVNLQGSVRYHSTSKEYTLEFSMSSSEGTLGLYTDIDGDIVSVGGTINAQGVALVTALWRDVPFNRNVTQTITIHGVALDNDYGGTQSNPLQSLSTTCEVIHANGTGIAYVFAGSEVSISADSNYAVTSVTSDRGLTITDGSLSGEIINLGDIIVTITDGFTLTIHPVTAYRTILLLRRVNTFTPYYGRLTLTSDISNTASVTQSGLPVPTTCYIQTVSITDENNVPLRIRAECVHTNLPPNGVFGAPWVVGEWCVRSVWNGVGHTRWIEIERDSVLIDLESTDFSVDSSNNGIYHTYIVPSLVTEGVYRVCFDQRVYGGQMEDQYIWPGHGTTEEGVFNYNNIRVPLSEHLILGPDVSAYVELTLLNWARKPISSTSEDVSLYSPALPEAVIPVTEEALEAADPVNNTLWYVPHATIADFNETQAAICVFNAGGGRFEPDARSQQPTAHDALSDEVIGVFFFDWGKELWVWCSCGDISDTAERKIRFKSLPVTSANGSDTPSLIPPEGMTSIDSWDTETPFFRGYDDADYIGNHFSFLYTLPARNSVDNIIRRTFYPHWVPARNENNIMKAMLVTPGYGTMTINNVTKVTETYTAKLVVLPIVPYGYSGTYCIDLGVTKKVTIGFTRVGLPYPFGTPTMRDCDDTSEDSARWSNGKWIAEMKRLLNRWQMETNGSELYLLRPGWGRLSDDDDDTDPMKQYYTKIIGENCYIASFPVNYTNSSPQTISGSIELDIGTLYPRQTSPNMVTVDYYLPIYRNASYLPGTMGNPYNGYSISLKEYNFYSVKSDGFYVRNPDNEDDTVLISFEGNIYNKTNGAYTKVTFKDGSTSKFGLELVEKVVTVNMGPFMNKTYRTTSVIGNLAYDPDPNTRNRTIQLTLTRSFNGTGGTSATSSYDVTIYTYTVNTEPGEGDIFYNYTTSMRYPENSTILLPEPRAIFSTAGDFTFYTNELGEFTVTGGQVYAWQTDPVSSPTPGMIFNPHEVVPVNDFRISDDSFRIMGVISSMIHGEGEFFHFFFPNDDQSADLHNNTRARYTVEITPSGTGETTVYWYLIGGGGGGGGAGMVESNAFTMTFLGGGGGGSGRINSSYVHIINSVTTYVVECGSGGSGGASYSIPVGNRDTGSGNNGATGTSTRLFIGDSATPQSEASGGDGGTGGTVSLYNAGMLPPGGDGSATGGSGSNDYEVRAGSGGSYYPTTSHITPSGYGGEGGLGDRYIPSTDNKYYKVPGGGGGAGGPYMDGLNGLGIGSTGASKGIASTSEGAPSAAGYGAGGGGGGGNITEYTVTVTHTNPITGNDYTEDVQYIKTFDGAPGGTGWAVVVVLNGEVTSVTNGGWV